LSKDPSLVFPITNGLDILKPIVAFFSFSFLFFCSWGYYVVLIGYAEPQGELPALPSPQQQQQLQQQGLTSNATALPSPQQQQQQAPPITFQQGEEEEPCDGAFFVGPGGVTKCM
jgi:hypothetical protein